MKKYILLFTLHILILIPPVWAKQQPIEAFLPKFEKYVEKAMKDWKAPGVAIAIVKDGKVIYAKGFGVKKAGHSDKIDENTVFQLASLTKNFTAVAIGQLVDEGKISLDDPITKYFPDFMFGDANATKNCTIRDFFSHRSGLPSYSADSLWMLGWSKEEIIKGLKHIPLKEKLGQKYGYQNALVGMNGLLIEKISGQPLTKWYAEHLFKPLNMTQTSMGIDAVRHGSNVATPHDLWEDNARPLDFNPITYTFEATSGINSSVADMAKWLLFHLNNGKIGGKTLISEQFLKEMRTPHVDIGAPKGGRLFPKDRVSQIEYGIGWFLYNYAGLKAIGHHGGCTGSRSLMVLVPEEGLGIVILSNLGGMRVSLLPEALRSKFFDLYLGLEPDRDWSGESLAEYNKIHVENKEIKNIERLQEPKRPQDLSAYEGEYENELYGKVKIYRQGDALFLSYRQSKAVPLTHWNGDEFSIIGWQLSSAFDGTNNGFVTFGIDPKSKKKALTISLLEEGENYIFYLVPNSK